MIFREETLQNVISAVTGNLRSIIFTFILALILVYFFSIFGFIFFQGKLSPPTLYSCYCLR